MASTSVYRRELLGRLGVAFEWLAPGVDEAPQPAETGRQLVARLAHAKASAVAVQRPEAWVIGSDQVAVVGDEAANERILGKPGSSLQCIEQLSACAGKTVSFLTAVVLTRQIDTVPHEFVDTTRVTFRALDLMTIERYVAAESPLDCAGGFKSEGLGITLCAAIDSSDPTALIGLPLIRLSALLRTVGFQLP